MCGEEVRAVFYLRRAELLSSKTHQWYLRLEILCPAGVITAICWKNPTVLFDLLLPPCVIEGTLVANSRGFQLKEIASTKQNIEDLWDFLPRGPGDEQENWAELQSILREKIRGQDWLSLLDSLLSDEDFCWRYQRSPAALTIHHPWRGGLVEHVLSCLKLMPAVVDSYEIDQELVTLGIWLHDVGKLWELDPLVGTYTPSGELVGHLVTGVAWLQERMNALKTVSPLRQLELLHCLVAHHGEKEKGSPRTPMSPEALVVHTLDRLDSEMFQCQQSLLGVKRGKFSDFHPVMKRRFYRPSPL